MVSTTSYTIIAYRSPFCIHKHNLLHIFNALTVAQLSSDRSFVLHL